MAAPRYVVVTPARDEAGYISDAAESLLSQTVPFEQWIVVDDGSSDGTQDIVRGYAERDCRIRLLEREDRAERRPGCGDLEAALVGLATLEDVFAYDYVAKIDADLVLPPEYFERLFAAFDAEPTLGVAGGHCYVRGRHGLELDPVPEDHVHGATKVYRRECLHDIWPLAEVWGWDTVDECRAQMQGWTTRSFLDPGVIHQKPMSGGAGGLLHGKYVLGGICYFLGYRTDYLLLRAAKHLVKPPYVIGGLAMACGYAAGFVLGKQRFDDAEFVAYLRGQQAKRLQGLLRGRTVSGVEGARP